MTQRFSVGAATHEGVLSYLRGHEAAVRCLAVTPDGARLASGGEDQTVRLWDVPARRALHCLKHEGEVYAVALSADGKLLASGGGDCAVRLWDARAGKPLRVVDGKTHVVTALALEATGQRALAGFDDGSIFVIEVASGKVPKQLRGAPNSIWAVAFSPDGKRAVSGDWDGKVRLWDLGSGKQLGEREANARNFGGAAFSGDGKRILYTVEKAVHVAAADGSGEPIVLEWHQSALYAFALSPDGRWLLSGGGEGRDASIGLVDVEAGALVHRYQVHDGGNRALAISGDGKLGFSAGYHDRRVAVLDLESRPACARAEGHPGPLLAAAFTPGQVLTAGMESTLRVFDLDGGAERAVLPLGDYVMPSWIDAAADGKLAVMIDGSTLRALELPGGAERAKVEEVAGYPRFAALSPDGQRVAVPDERVVRLWTLGGGKPVALKGHKESVTSLAFSPDGALLASGCDDATIRLWDGRTGAARDKPLKGHQSTVVALAFAAGGRLVSGSRDCTVRVWDVAQGKSLAVLEGHAQGITAVAVSADGRRVLSSADGERAGKVRLWDAATGKELARFDPHEGDPFALAFAADGRRAYSISRDDRMVEILELPAA